MSAREKFQIGDRVKLTALGLRKLGTSKRGRPAGAWSMERRAVVVGFPRGASPTGVRLNIVGHSPTTVEVYHKNYWEVVENDDDE